MEDDSRNRRFYRQKDEDNLLDGSIRAWIAGAVLCMLLRANYNSTAMDSNLI